MDDGAFDALARRLTGARGRRAVLAAAVGAVVAAARGIPPTAPAVAQGRCRVVFERCRWDDDCCSNHCNGDRCGKGEHGEERRTARVRRRRERRRERQRRRLEQRRQRQRNRRQRRNRRTTPAAPASAPGTVTASDAAVSSELSPAGEPR